MRAHKRKRPPRRRIAKEYGLVNETLGSQVTYIGSPEHKDSPSFAGQPKPRVSDASICDRRFAAQQNMLTGWLAKAIRIGSYSEKLEGKYPRFIWYMDDDTVYEARLVNRGNGDYKGYPLHKNEWPKGIEDYYG